MNKKTGHQPQRGLCEMQSIRLSKRIWLVVVLMAAGVGIGGGGCTGESQESPFPSSAQSSSASPQTPDAATNSSFAWDNLVDLSSQEHDLKVELLSDRAPLTARVRWTGAWRGEKTWDAAWIFFKAQDRSGNWQSVRLSEKAKAVAVQSDTPPSIKVAKDGRGAYLYLQSLGSRQSNDWTVRFNGTIEIPFGDDIKVSANTMNVRAYGVEMVRIPQGRFFIGDGQSDYRFADERGTPVLIGKDGQVVRIRSFSGERKPDPMLRTRGIYIDGDEGVNPDGPERNATNDAFPTGYEAFYAMKYEMTQGEYAQFLNALTPRQARARDVTQVSAYSDNRGAIVRTDSGYVAQRPTRSCNFLGASDVRAFADWAGLRPMTELEFEKAARGNEQPVPNEFAWGTTAIQKARNIVTETGELAATEDGTERVDQGNASYETIGYFGGDGGPGPLRVGIFAASSDGSRVGSGTSYYGLRGMSGNLKEAVVSLSYDGGRRYRGEHGDGRVGENGEDTVEGWPDPPMMGSKGGNFGFGSKFLRVSDRTAAGAPADRLFSRGTRLARTADN